MLITQKLYFTDAGEGFTAIFKKTLTLPGATGDAAELRSTYMKAAARINEAFRCKLANDSVFVSYAKKRKTSRWNRQKLRWCVSDKPRRYALQNKPAADAPGFFY